MTPSQAFLKRAQAALPNENIPDDLVCEQFGDSPELAQELLDLILEGKKTATCGAVWEYEAEGISIPRPGDVWLTGDRDNKPTCLLRVETVNIVPFNHVTHDFSFLEGEDDRSHESWQREHERYFRRVLPKIGKDFDPSMDLVTVVFCLAYL